jgi:hypothetical protein
MQQLLCIEGGLLALQVSGAKNAYVQHSAE